MTEHEYLTVNDAANLLRVSPKTVRALIRKGTLPSLRVGQQLRIKRTDVDFHLRAKSPEWMSGLVQALKLGYEQDSEALQAGLDAARRDLQKMREDRLGNT